MADRPPRVPATPVRSRSASRLDPGRSQEPGAAVILQVRRWLIAAIVLALVGAFAVGQVYYLKIHTVTRYEQAAPGAAVTVGDATYELLTLKTTPTVPGYDGEPSKPERGEAFVVATLRLTPHEADPSSALCSLDLLAEPHHSWEPTDYSTVAPPADSDSCDPLAQGRQVTVYLTWTVPASEVPALTGVVVEPYTGAPQIVLRPPA